MITKNCHKETYPLYGRLVTTEEGLVVPLIHLLKSKKVQHLGVVQWNDSYGNAYPELVVTATKVPAEDYDTAIQTLAAKFRWFYALIGADYAPLMERAVQQGIAGGAGKHVWMLNSAAGTPFLTSLVLEKGSDLAEATRGVGMLSSQGGRHGMPVYDKFVERWKALDNPEDTAYISSTMPQYPDEPDFVGPTLDSAIYNDVDPSTYASIVFDETILMGLAACKAAAQHNDDTQIYINGTGTFQNILNTSFQGASRNIRVDQITGTTLPETAFFRLTNVIEEPVNETHVTFRVQESDAFIDGIWVQQENGYVFNDGSTNVPSPPLFPTLLSKLWRVAIRSDDTSLVLRRGQCSSFAAGVAQQCSTHSICE